MSLRLVKSVKHDEEFTKKFVQSLNRVLSGTGVQLGFEENDAAAVTVRFAPIWAFHDIVVDLGLEYVGGNDGQLMIWFDDHARATAGLVLIGSDIDLDRRRATIAQELTQVLGPLNDSFEFPESVMYESGKNPSTAMELAPIDRRLLRFLYRHLKPGDDVHAVRTAFDMYWDSVPSN